MSDVRHDQFGYALDPATTAGRVERAWHELQHLHGLPKINGNEAEVLTSARQLIVTLAHEIEALRAITDAKVDRAEEVFWVHKEETGESWLAMRAALEAAREVTA